MSRRQYKYCAKHLGEAPMAPGNIVCSDCAGTPGGYNGCAVCGKVWPTPVSRPDARCWVCHEDLAHR